MKRLAAPLAAGAEACWLALVRSEARSARGREGGPVAAALSYLVQSSLGRNDLDRLPAGGPVEFDGHVTVRVRGEVRRLEQRCRTTFGAGSGRPEKLSAGEAVAP